MGHMSVKAKSGDVTNRLGVEQIQARWENVKKLTEKLIDAPGEEFRTYYYYKGNIHSGVKGEYGHVLDIYTR